MARSDKASIGYFSIDIDMNQDEKIEFLLAEHGLIGKAIIIELFAKVYGSNGYYIDWDDKIAKLFTRKLYLDLNEFNDVLNFALEYNIFDKNLYEKHGILTSKRIQKNYFTAAKYKKDVDVISEFLLVKKNILFDCIIRKNQNLNILDKNGKIIEVLDLAKKEKFTKIEEDTDKILTQDEPNNDKSESLEQKDGLNKEKSDLDKEKSDFSPTINYNKLILTNINLHWKKNPDLFFKEHVLGIYPKGKCRAPDTELNFVKGNLKNWIELLPQMHIAIVAQNRKREYDQEQTGKDQLVYVKKFKNWVYDKLWEEVPEIPDTTNDEYIEFTGNIENNDIPDELEEYYKQCEAVYQNNANSK